MMKKYLLSIILGILSFSNYSYGQLEVNFSGATGNANGTVDVDVTVVSGFTDIGGMQFTGVWDSLVMTYNSVVFTNPNLIDLLPGDISGPEALALVEGQFTIAYGAPNIDGNLNDGDVIFTLRFNLIGEECATTEVSILQGTSAPTESSYFDINFNETPVTSTSDEIMINGADCNGTGGGDELMVSAGMWEVGEGGAICIPLTVMNFSDVGSGSGTILWDPAVISYTGYQNSNLTGLNDNSFNATNTDNGELKFTWFSSDGSPVNIADGMAIFDICFTAVGDVGDMSVITLSEAGSLGFEFADDDGTAFPQILTNGKITIVEEATDPFFITVSDVTVNQDDGTGCVDISVSNFENILSMQYVLTWNTSILGNAMPTSFNLDGVNSNSFLINNGNGSASFSWNGNEGIDIPDNTVIYSLCFDLLGACGTTSTVQIVSQGSTDIEIVDGNTEVIENVSIDQGSITIDCPPDGCNGLSIANVQNACAGSTNGSVTINEGMACSYSWTNSAGAVIASTPNLPNVGVGVYTLTATCGGEVCTDIIAEVNELPGPTINGTVTNAACGDLGAIDVTVTPGNGNYSYNWNPAQPNSPNIANLNPGNYGLTVTDMDSGCTSTSSFDVQNIEADLLINGADVKDETCLEEDGAITLNVSGGCMPYTYTWSNSDIGNTPNAVNLVSGTYSVTITDDASPANMVTGSYTVDGFTALVLVGTPNITFETNGMGNGSITIDIDGGTEPYSYNWSGPVSNLPNSNTITGLSEGGYTVAVTDASGCDMIFGPFQVINVTVGGEPEFGEIGAVDIINGFSVVCNGDVNGSISGSLIAGVLPITLTLSGDKDSIITASSLATFVFDNLAAGTYTITASNAEGTVTSNAIELTEPDAIEYNIDKGCDEEEQCDGFIDLNASGGFGNLLYTWSDPDLSGDSVDDLCEGSYVVTLMDENGCQKMETIDIMSCGPTVTPGCYEVRNVITPNGDGMNETFAVTCINDFPSTLEVYDRWGALVYNQEEYDGSWSGISNSGDELIEGGYMYIIVIDFGQGNRQVMKGTITLLRD